MSYTRRFLLTPIGSLPAPVGSPLRAGWLLRGDPEVRVVAQDGRYALLLRRASGAQEEQILTPSFGEALLASCGGAVLRVLPVDAGPWVVRLYEGSLWGLVLGDLEMEDGQGGERAAVPPAPAGWQIVSEVTADARYQDAVLAGLNPASVRPLLPELAGAAQ